MKIKILAFMAAFISLSAVQSCCAAGVKEYKLKVNATYPHSTAAYTQGLFFTEDGVLIESAGQWGESALRALELDTGETLKQKTFKDKYFLEGSVIFGGELYVLTWTNHVAFVHDPVTFEYKRSYSYPREGWGLTTDGKSLIASDGSSNLYLLDAGLNVTRTIPVSMNGRPVRRLNELEYIDGKVWANVYLSDIIVIINPEDGRVEATIDCSGLLPRNERTDRTDVLNGIARDPVSGKIYLTGKYWPHLYEVEPAPVR